MQVGEVGASDVESNFAASGKAEPDGRARTPLQRARKVQLCEGTHRQKCGHVRFKKEDPLERLQLSEHQLAARKQDLLDAARVFRVNSSSCMKTRTVLRAAGRGEIDV